MERREFVEYFGLMTQTPSRPFQVIPTYHPTSKVFDEPIGANFAQSTPLCLISNVL